MAKRDARFRTRLLLSLGLVALGTACDKQKDRSDDGDSGYDCSDHEDPVYRTTISLTADTGDTGPATCPDPYVAAGLIQEAGGAGAWCTEYVTLLAQDEDLCTYEHSCFTCCGYGRPLLDEEGRPVTSETRRSEAWREPLPASAPLSDEQRRALATFWRHNAEAEHASVAGFHRFALDLLAHGAPPELLLAAQHAARQEVAHAVRCFSLASRYAGEPLGPAPMDLGGRVPVARNLEELAIWTLRDGALGETLAAYLADCALEQTTDPAAREALEEVVRDETEHAELAWATLAWALDVGGARVAQALRSFLSSAAEPQAYPRQWSEALAAHGCMDPVAEQAAAGRCLREVVLPVAEALLRARAA